MELELNPVEYCSVGTTLTNSMKLLPHSYKHQQKVCFNSSIISKNNCTPICMQF